MSNLWYRLTHPNIGFSITRGGWLVHCGISRSEPVKGVRNTLKDGGFCIFWEFDDTPLDVVRQELHMVQFKYQLPPITILRSSEPDNYHAYSFKRVKWSMLIRILMDTPSIDPSWLKLGFVRGHFVLRFTPKAGRAPMLVERLDRVIWEPDVIMSDLTEGTAYYTQAKRNI